MATRIHFNRKNIYILKKLFKKKKKGEKSKGVAATPSGPRPPQNAIRGGRVPPSATPLLFFFKKKN
jgi:hypothetical protein